MLTVILTGGASRRMGRDKAMLPWQGATMLQSLIDKYSTSLGPVAVSVNEKGRFSFTGAFEIVDRFPGMGPMNGLVSGFSETEEDIIFLTATDLPQGEPALAEKLRELLGENDACVIDRGEGHFEPLFGVYGRQCLKIASSCLAEGRRSFNELLRRARVRYVGEGELDGYDLEHVLMNVNTMEEYKRVSGT